MCEFARGEETDIGSAQYLPLVFQRNSNTYPFPSAQQLGPSKHQRGNKEQAESSPHTAWHKKRFLNLLKLYPSILFESES